MEFIRLPGFTNKIIPCSFNGLNPGEYYRPSEELGNYQWYIFSQKVISIEDFNIATKEMDPEIVEKFSRLSLVGLPVIPFNEFRSFLIMNYKGLAPQAKGMSEAQAEEYADKLIGSFLSCTPKKAVYVKFDHTDRALSCAPEAKSFDVPMLVYGVFGIVDAVNGEYFKLIMGGYDADNESCTDEISKSEIDPIKFCPIRKIPIEFNAFDPVRMNEGSVEELGNYRWYLHQYRLKDAATIVDKLEKNEFFRTNFPPIGRFQRSSIITFQEFHSFVVMNFKGWAPHARGMHEDRAVEYSDRLIKSFLSCSPENAVYFKCESWQDIKQPFLISGVMCVWDQENKEFFELIMGGTD